MCVCWDVWLLLTTFYSKDYFQICCLELTRRNLCLSTSAQTDNTGRLYRVRTATTTERHTHRQSNQPILEGEGVASLCPSIALLRWGTCIPWCPKIQKLINIFDLGGIRTRASRKKSLAAPKSSTLPTRSPRTAARHGCSGGVYTYTLGYTHPYVHPMFH